MNARRGAAGTGGMFAISVYFTALVGFIAGASAREAGRGLKYLLATKQELYSTVARVEAAPDTQPVEFVYDVFLVPVYGSLIDVAWWGFMLGYTNPEVPVWAVEAAAYIGIFGALGAVLWPYRGMFTTGSRGVSA